MLAKALLDIDNLGNSVTFCLKFSIWRIRMLGNTFNRILHNCKVGEVLLLVEHRTTSGFYLFLQPQFILPGAYYIICIKQILFMQGEGFEPSKALSHGISDNLSETQKTGFQVLSPARLTTSLPLLSNFVRQLNCYPGQDCEPEIVRNTSFINLI